LKRKCARSSPHNFIFYFFHLSSHFCCLDYLKRTEEKHEVLHKCCSLMCALHCRPFHW
jgi:hypothetical protein